MFHITISRVCDVALLLEASYGTFKTPTDWWRFGSNEKNSKELYRYFSSYEQDDWDPFLSCAGSAYNSVVSEDIGLSPFEMDLGWKPKGPIDVLFQSFAKLNSLSDFLDRLKAAMDDATYEHRLAKTSRIAEASIDFKRQNYRVGDCVSISHKLLKYACRSSQQSSNLIARSLIFFELCSLWEEMQCVLSSKRIWDCPQLYMFRTPSHIGYIRLKLRKK